MRSANKIAIPIKPMAPGRTMISKTFTKVSLFVRSDIKIAREKRIMKVPPIKAIISIIKLKCFSNQSMKVEILVFILIPFCHFFDIDNF